VQWALLSVVLLVSALSATLLATLYLLSTATETFAARAALTDAEAPDVRLVQRVDPDGPVEDVLANADRAATDFFAEIPFSTAQHVQSDTLAILREDQGIALGYFGVMDGIDGAANLRSGEWAASTVADDVQVTIPYELALQESLAVGDTLEIAPVFRRDDVTQLTIVGTYAAHEPRADFWRFDRYQGEGYIPDAALPLSGGLVVTDGFGPLITSLDTLATFDIDHATVTHVPDFSDVSLVQAEELLGRFESLERETTRSIGATGSNVRTVTTIDATLGGVIGSLAVTRSSVLVTGLLLLVLSVAALGQTARLMAERRFSEQHLMVARGGSGRQVFRLALIEAIALGIVTAAVAPVLARYAYQAIASQDAMSRAGMNLDPGLPPWTWVVTGVVGFVLIVILVAPLAKRQGTFVDAEQSRFRPGKRAAFQRSGLDLALVVLAGLAYWQLRSYESPVIADGGVARLDPLLAAGPALALLAGSLVAVRLIPAASKLLEGIAARGRRAVMPLAAWEVGRRSARAVSAILLLTLAVSVGTFSMSYLTTWRLSQDHQALFQHPADAVVSGLPGDVASHSGWLREGDLVQTISPVIYGDAVMAADTATRFTGDDGLDGTDIQVLATDSDGLAFYDQGRLGEDLGDGIQRALTATASDAPAAGHMLPDQPDAIGMTVNASTSDTALEDISVAMRAVLADSTGLRFTVDLGSLAADGEDHVVRAPLASRESIERIAYPVRLIGIQSVWSSTDEKTPGAELREEGNLEMALAIDDLAALNIAGTVPRAGEEPVYSDTAIDVAGAPRWHARNTGAGITSLEPGEHQIRAELFAPAQNLRVRQVVLSHTAEPEAGPVPVVLTSNLLANASVSVGDPILLQVGSTVVHGVVQGTSAILPDEYPHQQAVIANIDVLSLAVIQAGAPAPEPTQWWVGIDPERLEDLRASLPEEAQMTARAELAVSLMEDPLRVATQAALWLVTGAAIVLAAVGFAVHAVVTVRARHIEFAQLRAVGVQRGQLLRVVSAEALLLSLLGVLFGVALGVALGYLVAPLVAVGVDGRPPLPTVIVDIPWTTVGLLALEIAAVLALTVFLVGLMLRRINPAQLLRLGD
jgi:hypothetical protein